MEEVGYYRKNENDGYVFIYFSDDDFAVAYHTPIPIPGNTGAGRQVVQLENIKSREEAIEKLRKAVDEL